MVPKEISSLQHPIVKAFVKLRTSRSFRYEKREVVISGFKQIAEAKVVEILLMAKNTTPPCQAKETYIVPESILKKVAGTENPEPVVALVKMPQEESLKEKNWILALDGLSDPGNLGTLLRTAVALGWEGAFLTERSVDPFNDKALRAAKGATFKLPLQRGSVDDLIKLSEKFGGATWVADMRGTPVQKIITTQKALLILGNEAQGVDPFLKESFPKVSIPIAGIESLNVAVAGSLLMYELHP